MRDCMRNRLVACVGDRAVDVGYAGAHKILRRAHLQVRKLEVRGVGMRSGRTFWGPAGEQGNDTDHRYD